MAENNTFIVSATPILVDTDPETSIDVDKSLESFHETRKNNFTKSVFDVTVKNLENYPASDELKAYETKLGQEIRGWKEHITRAMGDLKEAKNEHLVVDKSILSKERREYIDSAFDLPRVVRRMRDFRSNAVEFMENEYAEILNLQENIVQLCKHLQNTRKESFLQERMSDASKLPTMRSEGS